jgi:nucleoside-diphosphate-sugar epimerase
MLLSRSTVSGLEVDLAIHSAITVSQNQTSTTASQRRARIAVVGADGFVGGGLSKALQADRIVYGSCGKGDTHISHARELLERADIVINAGGFRVRPGCTYADYQRSHEGATSAIVPYIRKKALLVHISSASVLGKSREEPLGPHTLPDPESFPSPPYALAKLKADKFVEKASAERGFRVIFLRPAVVYAENGAGMVDTLIRLAHQGIALRVYPRSARHHLCHMNLLVDVVRRIIEDDRIPHLSSFIVADPYTVTNHELEAMIQRHMRRKRAVFPMPVRLISMVLRHTFHSRSPKFDFRTWGEIFGVLNLDSAYDPSETFARLKIDPSLYSLDRTLQPLIERAFQQ